MAVDLSDLVEYLDARLNGIDPDRPLFPMSADRYLLQLRGAFWDAKVAGFFSSSYRESDGEVSNVDDPDTDLSRDEQQVIVMYAALTAVEAKLLALPTKTHDSAAPGLESDVERSAQVLQRILDGIRADLQTIRDALDLSSGASTQVYVLDGLVSRTAYVAAGYGWVN